MVTNPRAWKKWLSEGFIIAVSPVVAYLFTFSYEAGFCQFFGLPLQFISLNLTTILIVASVLSFLFFGLFFVINFIYMSVPKHSGPVWRGLIRMSPSLLLFFAYLLLYKTLWREWIWFLIVLPILIFLEFGLPLITQRKTKGYYKKLEAQEKLEEEVKTLWDLIGRQIGRMGFIILFTLLFAFHLSYIAGRAQALTQEEYLVAETHPESVVLRIYNSKMFLAPFNRETKEVQKSFLILKVAENPELILNLEKIGPIQVKE